MPTASLVHLVNVYLEFIKQNIDTYSYTSSCIHIDLHILNLLLLVIYLFIRGTSHSAVRQLILFHK